MMHSVKQVAQMLQVGTGLVTEFVNSGELDAIIVSLTRGKQKRLCIPDDALRQFLERRRVCVTPPRISNLPWQSHQLLQHCNRGSGFVHPTNADLSPGPRLLWFHSDIHLVLAGKLIPFASLPV